ncbi:MAG: ATP-binding protein [Acidobacteria bacterium]|nr:ATP-binding protein [Acidobacteriota bacterium]
MRGIGPLPVRTRLALWYFGVLSGILFLFSCGISAVMFFQLRTQLDDHAIEELETIEGFLRFRSDGTVFLQSIDHDHPYPATAQERFIEVRAPDGAVLFRNELLGNRSLGGEPEPAEGRNSYTERSIRLSDGTRVRLISRRHNIEGRPTLIRLGFNEQMLWTRFVHVAAGLFLGLPLALALAGVCGHFLAKRALSPIQEMARRVQEINAEQLNARLAVANPRDELGVLAAAFNDTLARLERSFEQLRRFTSDAAHELRTPLTAIRSVGEVGLQKNADRSYYREVIASMLEESSRLGRLVDGLLLVARADSGQVQLERTELSALELARETATLLDVLAEEKGQTVSIQGDEAARVHADRAILRQVLVNLLDNAIKYSPQEGSITVRVCSEGTNTTVIEVEDTGPGIPPEHRDRVFDRFYRTDEARSRETGGVGLGLAIAKWGAEVHGGHLELDSRPGAGCVFRLLLPHS